ncbi:MAG: NAD(P)H-hydrate dehydratase [Bacillota bacterium]
MHVVTAEEMRRLDERATSEYSIPSLMLMENAGLQVVRYIEALLQGEVRGKRVLIFAGKGNNGGDGFVVARHLINQGADVKIFLLCTAEDIKGDAAVNFNILKKIDAKIHPLLSEKDLHRVGIALLHAEVVVDAIYGTGFKGAAMGLPAKAIDILNETGKAIVAVDIPSGLEASTGKVHGPCIRAHHTITFGLPKLGLILEPGASHVGRLWVADISLPQPLLESQDLRRSLITSTWCRHTLPVRHAADHKGTFGHVLIVGGSEGLTGAVAMAGEAALRSGAGLVTVAVPRSLHPIMEIKTTELMTRPLPETAERSLSQEGMERVLELAQQASVVVMGPGMSQNSSTAALVRMLVPRMKVPLVLDADALNALSQDTAALRGAQAPIVLTPHPGEMSRLLNTTVAKVQENRVRVSEDAARQWGTTVVLKGAKTIVAATDGRTLINTVGNPGMATGGTGDVLSGMIGGLIAQGVAPVNAAAVAVYVHGAAGDRAAGEKGQIGLTAGDLLTFLPSIWSELEGKKGQAAAGNGMISAVS